MDLVEKYLGEITKKQVFDGILKVLGDNPMSLDQIASKSTLPMAKHGLESHLQILVNKGKVKETMQKGKYVYRKA